LKKEYLEDQEYPKTHHSKELNKIEDYIEEAFRDGPQQQQEEVSQERKDRAEKFKSEIEENVRYIYQNPYEHEFKDIKKLSY
jgi:Txe/YoeB family toxin of Txe-Axe toxin-antitoxin module